MAAQNPKKQAKKYQNGYSSTNESMKFDHEEMKREVESRIKMNELIKIAINKLNQARNPLPLNERNRRPTRVPDPNTINRNALMARENRKKKKEYLVNLEREVRNVRHLNEILKQKLFEKTKLVENLKDEQNFLKKNITSKKGTTNALTLATFIPKNENDGNNIKKNNTENQFDTPLTSPNYYDDFDDNSSYKDVKAGTVLFNDPFISTGLIYDNPFSFTAFDELPMLHEENWESLLEYNSKNDSEFSGASANVVVKPILGSSIISEHNYTNFKKSFPDDDNNADDDDDDDDDEDDDDDVYDDDDEDDDEDDDNDNGANNADVNDDNKKETETLKCTLVGKDVSVKFSAECNKTMRYNLPQQEVDVTNKKEVLDVVNL